MEKKNWKDKLANILAIVITHSIVGGFCITFIIGICADYENSSPTALAIDWLMCGIFAYLIAKVLKM